MLRISQRRLCYFLICVLLMAGMHTTYVKADSFAERAASIEAAQLYVTNTKTASEAQLRAPENVMTQVLVCVVENIDSVRRTVFSRVTNRSSLIRRDLRLPGLLLWALCISYFVLKCWHIEECLCLHEKKYRAALIKYIHDIDGKKRMACLT